MCFGINCYLYSEGHEIRVLFIVEVIQGTHVFTVRNQPIDRREMFTLGKFLVKTPEHLHDTKGRRGYRVREISTGWRYPRRREWVLYSDYLP